MAVAFFLTKLMLCQGLKGKICEGKPGTKPVFAPRTHLDALGVHVLPDIQIEWGGFFLAGVSLDSPSRSSTSTLLLLPVTVWLCHGDRQS